MKEAFILLKRDLRELIRTWTFRIVAALFMVLTLVFSIGMGFLFSDMARNAAGAGEAYFRLVFLQVTSNGIFALTFLPYVTFLWAFLGSFITREKAEGNLESLLATPLGPWSLLAAKCLVIFLPALVVSLVSVVFSSVLICCIAGLDRLLPVLTLPAPLFLTGFILNPLLFLGLTALTAMIGLIRSPDLAVIPTFLIGFGLLSGIPVLEVTGVIDLASWSFFLIYGGVTICLWVAAALAGLGLTRESIVLSGRET
jgi:ABC-type transport system involved in multi-copper enzyme maturation permease subunit